VCNRRTHSICMICYVHGICKDVNAFVITHNNSYKITCAGIGTFRVNSWGGRWFIILKGDQHLSTDPSFVNNHVTQFIQKKITLHLLRVGRSTMCVTVYVV